MKARISLLLIFSSLLAMEVRSQSTFASLLPDESILDVLILTAIENNPQLRAGSAEYQVKFHENKLISSDWLGMFKAGGNLNELSLQRFGSSDVPNQALFYPRYNFGVTIPLNEFIVIKHKKKINEQEKFMIEMQSEQIKRQITEEVKKHYIQLIQAEKTLALKRSLEQYILADINAKEQKFSDGSLELDEYTEAKKQQVKYSIEIMDAENAYLSARAELEAIIGVPLRAIIKN